MKKAFSVLLSAIIIALSVLGSTAVYANGTATDKLENIQTLSGFVPGGNSIIQRNCYGFASEVCKRLYGVSYSEGLYNNYQVKQNSGNYVTTGTYTSTKTVPDSQFVEDVIDFFVSNAVAGDIVHYGALNNSASKTHTVIVQYIDSQMMKIYHSNYSTSEYGSNTCHIDTIYWQSMRENPTRTIYSNNTLYSLNAIFYSTMKVSNSGGIGISISHYKYYDSLYTTNSSNTEETTDENVDADELEVTGLTVTGQACNKIDFEWNEVDEATKYYVSVNNQTKGTNFSKTVTESGTNIAGLDPGNVYQIKVCAYSGSSKGDYSTPVVTASKPQKEAIKSAYSSGSKQIVTKWKKLSGSCTGYQIQLSTSKNFKSGVITKTITNKNKLSYTRKKLKKGKYYYIRVRGYTSYDGGKIYGNWSSLKSVKCR